VASAGESVGDLLDRCTCEVRVPDGEGLGTGVLVGPRQVLTCCHVVGDLERVDLYDGTSAQRLTGATVEERGDPDGPDDLALLELDAPLLGRGVIRFAAASRGDPFWTVGFPERGKEQVHGVVGGPSPYHGWHQVDPLGTRRIEPGFSGGAVWVQAKHAAVGLVTHRDEDGVAYAITSEQIRELWPQRLDAEMATRCAGYLSRLGRKLEAPEVRSAIADGATVEGWRRAAGYPDLLAEALCLETDPDQLAVGLSAAYRRLDDARDDATAEQLFEVLMEALPATLVSRWRIELPEIADSEVRLELVGLVLAELVLAASENGAADFHRWPDREDTDEPRAKHRVPGPSEVGFDPEGEEAASDLAADAALRLALDAGGEPRSPIGEFLGFLATRRPGAKDARFIDRSVLDDLKGAPEGTLLELLNRRLERPISSGRRLYLVTRRGDDALVEGLCRHLPGLKVVTLDDPTPEQYAATEEFLHVLRNVFHRRNSEKPKP